MTLILEVDELLTIAANMAVVATFVYGAWRWLRRKLSTPPDG